MQPVISLKLLKIIALLGVAAFLLPSNLWQDPSDLRQRFGSGQMPAADAPSIRKLARSGFHFVATFCESQPFVCEVSEVALRKLHVFAIEATGSLHVWLKESLDE